MLPPDIHEEACELFCMWLHRLEERDKRNAAARLQEQRQPAERIQQQRVETQETNKESKDAKEHYHTQQA